LLKLDHQGSFRFLHADRKGRGYEEVARAEFNLVQNQLLLSAQELRGELLTFKRTIDDLLE